MLRVIVSFGREDYEHRRFREQGQTAVDERVKLTVSQSLYTLGVQTATAAGISLVMGLGAWHVIQGKISIGELIVLITYITSVYQPLEQISSDGRDDPRTAGPVRRLAEPARHRAGGDREARRGRARPGRGRVTRRRRLASPIRAATHTLSDISFDAQPGERVAIVGQTGAGKSTLMSLLIRFYDPSGGPDRDRRRRPARPAACDSLRDQISVVLQEPLLFSGTIAENIRYGRLDATEEEIEAAAAGGQRPRLHRAACPTATRRCSASGGAQISGGERQRICVARAFLKDAPILILDEPTSSIDSKTEAVDPRRARRADGGADLVHDRPPPLDRPPRRPDPGPRARGGSSSAARTRSCCAAAASTASCTRPRRASASGAAAAPATAATAARAARRRERRRSSRTRC